MQWDGEEDPRIAPLLTSKSSEASQSGRRNSRADSGMSFGRGKGNPDLVYVSGFVESCAPTGIPVSRLLLLIFFIPGEEVFLVGLD